MISPRLCETCKQNRSLFFPACHLFILQEFIEYLLSYHIPETVLYIWDSDVTRTLPLMETHTYTCACKYTHTYIRAYMCTNTQYRKCNSRCIYKVCLWTMDTSDQLPRGFGFSKRKN